MTHMCKQVAIVVLLAAGLYIGQVDPLIGNLQNILRYTFESFSSHIYNLKTDLKSKCISMSHLGGHRAYVFSSPVLGGASITGLGQEEGRRAFLSLTRLNPFRIGF